MKPWLFRHTVFPLWERRQKTQIQDRMKFLNEIERDSDVIRHHKDTYFLNLFERAFEEIPNYRMYCDNHGVTPYDVDGVADLAMLPIMTKDDIKSNRFINLNIKDWRSGMSSGSTGEPKKFRLDYESISCHTASLFRCWGWGGYRLGDLFTQMRFASSRLTKLKRLKNWVFNDLWLPALGMTDDIMDGYIEKIRKKKPKTIRGYGSAIYLLSERILDRGIQDIQIRNIQTHGETLSSSWRRDIKSALQGSVIDGYGAEGIHLAHQCELSDYYHIPENAIIETYKDGQLLITNLVNHSQPLIRYAVEDSGELTGAKCSCGRGHELLKKIDGRITDILRFRDGTKIVVHFFTYLFEYCQSFEAFQVYQPDYDHVTIKVIKSPDYSELEERRLAKEFEQAVGKDVSIEFEYVDEIPVSPSGKRRFIISEVE